jgi:hypothetical protein
MEVKRERWFGCAIAQSSAQKCYSKQLTWDTSFSQSRMDLVRQRPIQSIRREECAELMGKQEAGGSGSQSRFRQELQNLVHQAFPLIRLKEELRVGRTVQHQKLFGFRCLFELLPDLGGERIATAGDE